MAVKVLSLFDGLACGMLAFMKAGVQVSNYYAYEIDKYAIQIDIAEIGAFDGS